MVSSSRLPPSWPRGRQLRQGLDETLEVDAVLAADEVDAAVRRALEAQDRQVGAQRGNEQVGHEGDAETGGHHAGLREQVVGHRRDAWLEPRPGRELSQHDLGADVVLDPGLAGQALEVDPVRSGERVSGSGDDDHLVVVEVSRPELGVPGQAGWGIGDHGRVELAADHHRSELGRDPGDHRDLGAAGVAEPRDGPRHERRGRRRDRAQHYRRGPLGRGPGGLASTSGFVDDQPRVREQRGAGRRRRDPAGASVQQAHPYVTLERRDLAGEPGLGEAGDLGGRADGARPAHLDERVPGRQRHDAIMTEAHGEDARSALVACLCPSQAGAHDLCCCARTRPDGLGHRRPPRRRPRRPHVDPERRRLADDRGGGRPRRAALPVRRPGLPRGARRKPAGAVDRDDRRQHHHRRSRRGGGAGGVGHGGRARRTCTRPSWVRPPPSQPAG